MNMKLYDIPRNSQILLTIGHAGGEGEEMLCDFRHVDGMYSLIETPDGQAVHLGASTEVKLVDEHYELV